jgi:hypothetical protein
MHRKNIEKNITSLFIWFIKSFNHFLHIADITNECHLLCNALNECKS